MIIQLSNKQCHHSQVVGMCGNFNGKDDDDFKTPTSGDLAETSAKLFGDSWKIDPKCIESLVQQVLICHFSLINPIIFASKG